MRNVLIVSPHFPPVNAPDMQRVRMGLSYYERFGWNPSVLAVLPQYVNRVCDPQLLDTVPHSVPVDSVKALPLKLTRLLGVGALGFRALPFLFSRGNRIIKERRPDLIYFSTTMFPVMVLGRLWKSRWNVPYVFDMQDPWVSDYYDQKPAAARPRKYWAAQRIHKFLEPLAMKDVSGIISVVDQYHLTLRSRYPWINKALCATIPFGTSEHDFQVAKRVKEEKRGYCFDRDDGCIHGVYVGVLGPVMKHSCQALCQALQQGLQKFPQLFSRVRLHFVGTDYTADSRARATIAPIAQQFGVHDFISEQTQRVPYLEALRLLGDADFLMLMGSDNPHYSASKVYPYIMSHKPLLSIFHEESSVVQTLQSLGLKRTVSFSSADTPERVAADILPVWEGLLKKLPYQPSVNWEAFSPYTAQEIARKQCQLFDQVIAVSKQKERYVS